MPACSDSSDVTEIGVVNPSVVHSPSAARNPSAVHSLLCAAHSLLSVAHCLSAAVEDTA